MRFVVEDFVEFKKFWVDENPSKFRTNMAAIKMNIIIPNPEMYSNVFRWYLRAALFFSAKVCKQFLVIVRGKMKAEKRRKEWKGENMKTVAS